MGFVNEFIPAKDVEKYSIKAIDEKFRSNGTSARDWTIDRDRDIYLRNVAIGGGSEPELRNRTLWTFYWHGDPMTLRLDLMDGGGEGYGSPGGPGWSHWRLVFLNGSNGVPAHLRSQKAQILETLKEALTAYKGGGMYSADYADYSVTLDIAEECVL